MRRSGLTRESLSTLAALALPAAACSGTEATASTDDLISSSEECFLGLDLWDTDPALTWIADGRVWVRAGDHQACLTTTRASDIWWSPDGRRLLLDNQLVLGGSSPASPDLVNAEQVLWQQSLGETLFIVTTAGLISTISLLSHPPRRRSRRMPSSSPVTRTQPTWQPSMVPGSFASPRSTPEIARLFSRWIGSRCQFRWNSQPTDLDSGSSPTLPVWERLDT